ncbi:MAG: CDP-diglyceride synthetase [Candidatus Paceibacteria bacterium]|jgi:CDP-diglyceride synthetase
MASRLSKIILRTAVGGTLTAVMGGFMTLAYRSSDGFPVWLGGALISAGCVYEVTRMKKVVTGSMALGLFLGLVATLIPGALHYLDGDLLDTSRIYDSYLSSRGILTVYLAGAACMLLPTFVVSGGKASPILSLALALWVLAPMSSWTLIWADYGAHGLLALLLLSKVGDIFGYYVGNAIGKSHPFPNVSPGKTTAGCVASLVAGTLTGALCVHYGLLPNAKWGWSAGLVAGAVLNLAAQAGDLAESRVKRMSGVKDSGSLFGPSGGWLDLADSLLFSVPAALLVFPLLFA